MLTRRYPEPQVRTSSSTDAPVPSVPSDISFGFIQTLQTIEVTVGTACHKHLNAGIGPALIK
jgi:hypothetical protein